MQAVENERPAIGWWTRSATRLVMPESRAQYKRDPLTNYELKTELGFDHFEGRSYPGCQHHVVLSAVAYVFLQLEWMRRNAHPTLTFPAIHAIVQEIFTALLFAQQPDYYKRIQELQKINLCLAKIASGQSC